MTFKELAEKVLRETGKAMTPFDIWKYAQECGWLQQIETVGKTPARSIGAQIYVDIKAKGNKSVFDKVTKGVFALRSKNSVDCIDIFVPVEKDLKYLESDLHKFLVSFVYVSENFQCRCKTIDEKHSLKKQKGEFEWLHPDIVGVYYHNEDYEINVIDSMKNFGNSVAKLFSFELKKSLDMATLRQKYFQAVSNSSWANEGYLVVYELSEEENFRRELRRLNNAFGIGIIKINAENIYESEIIYPAENHEQIDWDTVNILYGVNSDFKEFIDDVCSSTSPTAKKTYGKYDECFADEVEAREKAKKLGML